MALTPQQHSLVADVAEAHVVQGPGGLGDQRGELVGVVHVGVQGQVDPALASLGGEPLQAGQDVVLEEVLGQAHQPLGGQPDVADVLDVEQGRHELLQDPDGQVGHVAAGHDHVAHAGGAAQVVEDLLVAGRLLDLELVLGHLGVELPTRSMRVQWPQYWGQVGSSSARTLVG